MSITRIMKAPDYFTLLNSAFGLCSILVASRSSDEAGLAAAVAFVLLAALSDGADGFLARKLGSGPLGVQLDSLADLVSFGVAPAFLALRTLDSVAAWPAGVFYLACGALRLARFNISIKSDEQFEGLPIPAAGIALSGSVLAGRPAFSLILMLILALLMVSNLPYPKIRDPRAVLFAGLTFLAAGLLFWMRGDAHLASVVLLAFIALYLTSPVVILCQRRGK